LSGNLYGPIFAVIDLKPLAQIIECQIIEITMGHQLHVIECRAAQGFIAAEDFEL
jgi:hypothetical protein